MEPGTSDHPTTDADLVSLARNGHANAYAELVRRWSARVLAVCHARVRMRDAAEDLAQETLLRGFRSLARLKESEKFGPWLCGIAERICLDWLKSKHNNQVTFSDLAPDGRGSDLPADDCDVAAALGRADEREQLMRQVESLSDGLREVLMLYYYHDMTYRDMAELLGVTPAAVNQRLTRARARLRAQMSKLQRESS